mmetsp:Transcript_65840/g.122845  ORF Transcript_65840/g.122845 Transcript_65840/m.122845 type:complete len:128 (+) Transcript_65840:1406-1789(+)
MCVPTCGEDLAHTITNLQDGHVKGAATKIKHHDGLVGILLQAVSQRSSGGLIQYSQYLEACDLPCIFGRHSLTVVEVGRHCDHGFVDLGVQVFACISSQLAQNLGRDFLRSKLLVTLRAIQLELSTN